MKLLPPKNLRSASPRCCTFCKYFVVVGGEDNGKDAGKLPVGGGYCYCKRPGGPQWDTIDRLYDWQVCDRFAPVERQGE